MFKCTMQFLWTLADTAGYEFNPLDSKYLTRAGADLSRSLFEGVPEDVRTAVLGEADMPTEQVPAADGTLEEGVTLDGVRHELQRRLDLLHDFGWRLSVLASPEGEPVPYFYPINPPDCNHGLVVETLDQQGNSEGPLTISHPHANVRGIVMAFLAFFEA